MNMIDGRWLLDFGGVGHPDPTGNELILGDGKVAIARNGAPIGAYDVDADMLVITLNMPTPPGEQPMRLVAKLLLPDPGEEAPRLPGLVEAIVEGEPPRIAGPCFLVRRDANA
jgi:hypothetical protein